MFYVQESDIAMDEKAWAEAKDEKTEEQSDADDDSNAGSVARETDANADAANQAADDEDIPPVTTRTGR